MSAPRPFVIRLFPRFSDAIVLREQLVGTQTEVCVIYRPTTVLAAGTRFELASLHGLLLSSVKAGLEEQLEMPKRRGMPDPVTRGFFIHGASTFEWITFTVIAPEHKWPT